MLNQNEEQKQKQKQIKAKKRKKIDTLMFEINLQFSLRLSNDTHRYRCPITMANGQLVSRW